MAPSHIDLARSERPHDRVRRFATAGLDVAATPRGANLGPVAHTDAVLAPVALTPAGVGAARLGATGASTGRAAGGTPSPVAGRSPSIAR